MDGYSDAENQIIGRAARQKAHLGTFPIATVGVNGKPMWKAGPKTFENLSDALHYGQSGIKTFETITQGSSIRDLPRLGAARYRRLESLMESLAENDSRFRGATLERISFERSKDATQTILSDFTEQRATGPAFTGFYHNTDENIGLLRIKMGGKDGAYLSDKEMWAALENFYDFDEFDDHTVGKFEKTINALFNMEEYGGHLPGGKRLQVKTFDMNDVNDPVTRAFKRKDNKLSAGEIKHGVDGQALGNPRMLMDRARQMRQEAGELSRAYDRTDMSMEAIRARADVKQIKKKAKGLSRIAREGGRMEQFRAEGLMDLLGNELKGVLKGDIYFPPLKDFLAYIQRLGVSEADSKVTDILVPKDAFKTEYSRTARNVGEHVPFSQWSTKITEASGRVNLDLQTMATVGDHLIDRERLSRHTYEIMNAEVDNFMSTGKISPGYEKAMQDILAKEVPDNGENLLQLQEQKIHAKAVLAMQRSSLPPSPEMTVQVQSGIKKSFVHHRYPNAPAFIAPGALRTHLGNAFLSPADDIVEGEMRYIKGYGWGMHEQTLADVTHLLGGSDLDDSVNAHLRRVIDPQTGNTSYKAIIMRNPNTIGEYALLDFDYSKNLDAIEMMGRDDPRFRKEAEAIAEERRLVRELKKTESIQAQAAGDFQNINADFQKINATMSTNQTDETRAQYQTVHKKYRTLHKELEDADKNLSEAILRSEGIDINATEQRLWAMGDQLIPEATLEQLAYFDHTTIPRDANGEIKPRKSYIQGEFEGWKTQRGITNADLLTNVNIEEEANAIRSQIGHLEPRSVIQLVSSMLRQGVGDYQGLGGFINVDMLSNYMIHEMERKPGNLARGGIIPHAPLEDVVDLLTQGASKNDFTFEDAIARKHAMLRGVAEAVGLHDGHLPSEFFDERMKSLRYRLEDNIREVNPNFFDNGRVLEDVMGDTVYERGGREFGGIFSDLEEKTARNSKGAYASTPTSRYVFSMAEQEEADRVFKIYESTLDHYNEKGIPGHFDNLEISSLARDLDDPQAHASRQASLALQREFRVHLDDTGRLTDEGTHVFGALMQSHRKSLIGVIKGNLSNMAAYTDMFFGQKQGNIASLKEQMAAADPDSDTASRLRGQIDAEEETIRRGVTRKDLGPALNATFDDDLESGLDLVRNQPGFKRNAQLDASFGEAARTTKGGRNASEEFWTKFHPDQVRELWQESKLLRKGTVAAAGIIGFSAIYQKFRDRSPEDMQGPPLLPGGSAYERTPQYDMQPGSMSPVPNGSGGVTYKIIADGQYDPLDLQSAISNIVGGDVPMDGSYYNTQSRISRPRYNRQRDGLLGQV